MTAHTTHRKLTRRHNTGLQPGWTPSAVLRSVAPIIRGTLAAIVLMALVAGLPWALAHFVGWPLPDHMPTWDEVQATLLNPMSPQLLLDSLAVLCWIVWLVFTLDVLRCAVDAARGITWPQARPPGPVHGIAAALIGTIVLTLLGNRAPSTATAPTVATLTNGLAPVAVTAPLTPGVTIPSAEAAAVAAQTTLVIDRGAPAPPGTVQATEEVRLPRDGTYDSLWRVAERLYGPGGGLRWPELFQLNRGVEQPDGHALTNPNLVRPGWKITAYIPAPPDVQQQDEHPPQASTEQPAPSTSTPRSTQSPPAPTLDEADQAVDHGADQSEPGLNLVTGAFVSLGLAAGITSAVTTARLWRRRRYRIGSGDRSDLERTIAPVVRALHVAHSPDEEGHDPGPISDMEFVDLTPAPSRIHITAAGSVEPDDAPAPVPARVGVRGGRELAVNLASTRGLGLTGPGAMAAARALLLHLLTAPGQPTIAPGVIIPASDLLLVFDGTSVENLPSTVLVVDSLAAALEEMETALLTRTRHVIEGTASLTTFDPLVLLAKSAPHAERRLQAVLDNGSAFGLAGILLGQWRPGATVRTRHDGTVSATSPGLGAALADTRLFTLPATDANDLLRVLHDAEGPDLRIPSHDRGMVNDEIERPDAVHNATSPAPRQDDLQAEPDPLNQTPTAAPTGCDGDLGTKNEDAATSSLRADEHHHQSVNNEQASPQRPLAVRVLGRVQLILRGYGKRELDSALTPKQREVLLYLALHPDGVRREALNDAVWPDSKPPRPYNSFHNTLSLLRRALSSATDGALTDLVVNDDGRYQLNPELVTADLWQLQDALQTRRPADRDALARLTKAVELYLGDLAEDLTASWVEPFRESVRRDVLDALGVLIRALSDSEPETALALLERTRKLDRYNEGIYRDIIRIQARLGQHAAIPRTITLLTTTLEDIGQCPGSDTLNLAEFLQRRSNTRRPASRGNAAAS